MGNLNTVISLQGMSQEFKDEHIFHYVAVAPPMLGAHAPVTILSGTKKVGLLGIEFVKLDFFR
jgi:hypothetical protein